MKQHTLRWLLQRSEPRYLYQCVTWHDFATRMHGVLASDMEHVGSHVDVVSDITTRYLATVAISAETVVACGIDGRETQPMELVER